MIGQSAVLHLSTMAQPQAGTFVAAHAIHALAVVVPIIVIIGALYLDRLNSARRKWLTGHRRGDSKR